MLNTWQILVRQQRYKTLPLLFFYIYALIALGLRLIYSIWGWSVREGFQSVNNIYIVAKLCVRLMQTWMILEIALRVRNSIPRPRAPKSQARFEKWMKIGQYSVMAIASSGFAIFIVFDIISAHKAGNEYAFEKNFDLYSVFISYSFLTLFAMMLSVNIYLAI